MIKLFQYHKFRELFLIEQNVEVKIDLEILGVSLDVYNIWVSRELAMSSEVRGRCETPSYFLTSLPNTSSFFVGILGEWGLWGENYSLLSTHY